jgi:HD-GYP domain-containing protein (c-di-GMP phosphodiesterase class II)
MLASIARALEQRDRTYGHGARVAALAEPVAVRLGWDRERIRELRFAAPLHDVGKVKVRPQLLAKPGPLTLEEVAEVRRHPGAGARLVLHLRRFLDVLPYILFHHERWDGAGYPAGLRRHSIPIEARLIALADAFDAMISPRPYRSALTHEHALAEVETGRERSSIPWLPGSSSRRGRTAGTPGRRPPLELERSLRLRSLRAPPRPRASPVRARSPRP